MDNEATYKADPSWFDLPTKAADVIHQVYVVEIRSMDDAIRLARVRTGIEFKSEDARRFIRANGWKRPPQFYSKRSPWQGQARASIAEKRAKRRTFEND
jgi:hypothetical protein